MENVLISEINEIRKKMGLTPSVIFEKNEVAKNSRLLLEGDRDDIVKGFLEVLGIQFAKNLDEVRLGQALQENPVVVKIPKDGGGFEDYTCRSIDDLITAAEKTQSVTKNTSLEESIKIAVSNNPKLRVEFGSSLARGNFNKTVDNFISYRNKTRASVVTPTNITTPEQRLQQDIVNALNERLGVYDELVGRTTDDLNKTSVNSLDYKSNSTQNYQLSDELAPIGREGDASYFGNMSKQIQDKINELQQLQEANTGFFNSLRDAVNTSSITTKNKESLIKQINAAENACKTQADTVISDMKINKSIADDLAKVKGEEAKDWLKNGVTPDTNSNVYVASRIGVEVLAFKGKISAAGMQLLDNIFKPLWLGIRKGISKVRGKDFEPTIKQNGLFKRLAERYKTVTETSISFFEDVIRASKVNGTSPKAWGQNFIDTIFLGESRRAFSYDETSERVKGIINQMLQLSDELIRMDNAVGGVEAIGLNPGKMMNRVKYETQMSNLMKELKGVMRNTTKNRFYDELESGNFVTKLQKLEDLATQVEKSIKDMADAEIPGAKELSDWYTDAVKTDGDVSAFMQLSKWLDTGAEDMMIKGLGSTDYGTFSFSLKDMIPVWDIFTGTLSKIGQSTGILKKVPTDDKFQQQVLDFVTNIPNEIKTKIGNIMTYGHFTNAKDIERIFAVHGPIKGAFTMAVRETIMHTVLVGTLETVKQIAFYLERAVCAVYDEATKPGDQNFKDAENCLTNVVIAGLEAIGDITGMDKFKIEAAQLNDRVRADLGDIIQSDLIGMLTNWKTYIIVPLFNDNAIFAKQFFDYLGLDGTVFDAYIENEISTFEDTYGGLFSDLIDFVVAVNSNPQAEYANSRAKELQEKWLKDAERIKDTGYLYNTATGSEAARKAKEVSVNDVKKDVETSETLNLQFLPSTINNSTQVDLPGGRKIGLKDGFFSILTYPDEPTGEYTFKNGDKYNFTADPNEGYSKHDQKASEWFLENNKIGINDFISQKFYKLYPRLSMSESQLKNYYDNGRLNVINGNFVQIGDLPYSTGRIYFSSPDGQYLYDLGLVDKVISIDRIKKLIQFDDKKRRIERAQLQRKQETEQIEKTTGAELKQLRKNLETLNKEISEYEDNDKDEVGSSYFSSYIRIRMMRDGTKKMCNDFYYGKILKKTETEGGNNWCSTGKYWDPIEGKYMIYSNLYDLIDAKEKIYNNQYSESDTKYNEQINESKTRSKLSNLINEFIYKNNMENIMKRRIQRISFLNETKRFDEDDYKHWKDTFKFQAIDEKNPGRYKDVKINMEDVMDRINHFRKKYDEDDAFVRAVVDTHENVVRFMFTRDLANIKEGYEPSGFAKILLQLRESRGEMEIWSVSRPASGNWFLVKGDFTPKELAGMDLEKREPADKEPKKKENPVKTFKKKEDDAGQKLKNNEKDGIDELPKNVQIKLKQKFGRGWTTEEPSENLKPHYSKSSVNSVFGEDIEIYKLNANDDFFDYLQKFSSNVDIKRGFCRALQLSKNKEGITPQQKRVITHTLGICNNKFNFNLGLTIREPKK
jgi:hypothetical protein